MSCARITTDEELSIAAGQSVFNPYTPLTCGYADHDQPYI